MMLEFAKDQLISKLKLEKLEGKDKTFSRFCTLSAYFKNGRERSELSHVGQVLLTNQNIHFFILIYNILIYF